MAGEQNPLDEGLCNCKGRRDPIKVRRYVDSSNNLIGTFCLECQVESLTWEYVGGITDRTPGRLYPRKPQVPEQNMAFQVQCNNTEVDPRHFADILKVGDHVMWCRMYLYWHHGIVLDMHAESNSITVAEWSRTQDRIIESKIKVNKDQMHLVNYPENITKENCTELVLARARSRIGDTGYNVILDNCEAFATFCKCGVEKSHQIEWVIRKIKEILVDSGMFSAAKEAVVTIGKAIITAEGRFIGAEIVERLVRGSNWVGAGIVIALETGLVIWDLNKAYQERKKGNVTRNDFIRTLIRRCLEGIGCSSLTIAGSLVGGMIGSPLGPVGVFVGGIVGGIVSGAIGKSVGTVLGNMVGTTISCLFQNDVAISSIDELRPGDHIVVYAWCLHPRCHAIVVEHSGTQILVIRNTFVRGVVKEWLPFTTPLFKVVYRVDQCYVPEIVLEKAMSRIGENEYDLASYSCKTFARQCKLKEYN